MLFHGSQHLPPRAGGRVAESARREEGVLAVEKIDSEGHVGRFRRRADTHQQVSAIERAEVIGRGWTEKTPRKRPGRMSCSKLSSRWRHQPSKGSVNACYVVEDVRVNRKWFESL